MFEASASRQNQKFTFEIIRPIFKMQAGHDMVAAASTSLSQKAQSLRQVRANGPTFMVLERK